MIQIQNLPVSIKGQQNFPEKFSISSLKIPSTNDSWLFASKDQVVKAVDLHMIALLLQGPKAFKHAQNCIEVMTDHHRTVPV